MQFPNQMENSIRLLFTVMFGQHNSSLISGILETVKAIRLKISYTDSETNTWFIINKDTMSGVV